MDIQQKQNLKTLIEQQLNYQSTPDIQIRKLSGGAIQENWSIDAVDQDWSIVLRKNADTVVEASSDRVQEYQLLSRLFELGIQVPKPLYFSAKDNFLHSDFFMMQKISGVTEGHKLVRLKNPELQKKIVMDIGRHLARIHQIKRDSKLEKILEYPDTKNYLTGLICELTQQLENLQRARPILEFALQWMQKNQPSVDEIVLVHGDYRTGNLMIEEGQVNGILDWEFTHWGDRREDIGWFTAQCWRFGQNQALAGGIGEYEDFMRAYAELNDIYIPEFEMKFWHVLAHVRWAIVAMQQSDRNLNHSFYSLELALTEFLVPQLEKNILDLIGDKT